MCGDGFHGGGHGGPLLGSHKGVVFGRRMLFHIHFEVFWYVVFFGAFFFLKLFVQIERRFQLRLRSTSTFHLLFDGRGLFELLECLLIRFLDNLERLGVGV